MKTRGRPNFYFEDKVVEASHGQSLLESLLSSKCEIDHSCGGNGTCGTCLIVCSNPKLLPARTELEAEIALDRGFSEQERLSCQVCCDEAWSSNKIQFSLPRRSTKKNGFE